jgi:hypothetical protein
MQLSYSTADIERSVFYGQNTHPVNVSEPVRGATLILIDGEYYLLNQGTPPPAQPLTDQSGIIRFIGAADQG